MKICSKCKVKKDVSEFNKFGKTSDGLRCECRLCQKKYFREFYERNMAREKERTRQYISSHRDEVKEYRKKNSVRDKIYKKKYREEHAEEIKKYTEIVATRRKTSGYYAVYVKNKSATDLQFRLKRTLRSRLRSAIKSNLKSGSCVRDLGCSVEELKDHIESQFQPGMTWENWSYRGWHIDHIKPLASFDLSNREQFIKACHYTNLQPLWAKDNIIKSDKYV